MDNNNDRADININILDIPSTDDSTIYNNGVFEPFKQSYADINYLQHFNLLDIALTDLYSTVSYINMGLS